MVVMIIAIAVGAGACPMNLTLVFLLFILSIHIIAGLGIDYEILSAFFLSHKLRFLKNFNHH